MQMYASHKYLFCFTEQIFNITFRHGSQWQVFARCNGIKNVLARQTRRRY